jgi:flagellar motility protein MotE (MotC chaperone)
MKYILIVISVLVNLSAIEQNPKLFECTKIFEERKEELLIELERIDEQQQALNSLKAATDNLIQKKEASLAQKEQEISKKLEEITQKESSIKELTEKNEKILEEIKGLKQDKVSQTYAKMKPASAASILNVMDVNDSTSILRTLNPQAVGKILSKMDGKKASEITLMLNTPVN